MSIVADHIEDGYDDLDVEETWDEHIPESRHEEMLRQDRGRLIAAGLFGVGVAAIIIVGALVWVATMRLPAGGGQAPVASASEPEPRAAAAPTAAELTAAAARNDIEAKLHALAPHEALAVSQAVETAPPKRVKTERIGTKVD